MAKQRPDGKAYFLMQRQQLEAEAATVIQASAVFQTSLANLQRNPHRQAQKSDLKETTEIWKYEIRKQRLHVH
jgi:hypothetical protein